MRSDSDKRLQRHLLVCLGTTLGICSAVELLCLSVGIAPFFTPSLAINEKMRFIRDHRLGSNPLTVVSGASVALNDLDSDLLQDEERRPFINLGANGVSVPTSERLFKRFAALYRVREVIFAASPIEMRDTYRTDIDVPDSVFRRYVQGSLTIAEEFTYRDIPGLISYWKHWPDFHTRTAPSSLAFSKTGAVPLDIYRDTSDPRIWEGDTIQQDLSCLHCVNDLANFCRDVRAEGRPFTIVVGPIRPAVLARMPKVRAISVDRLARIRAVAKDCGASLFDATDFVTLDDTCFANSIHLNAHGMSAMTALFARYRRGEPMPRGVPLRCSASHGSSGTTLLRSLAPRSGPQ
jgi:hypothetical protein